MLETDLYGPLRDYFVKLGYKVNGEVKDCDLTAVKGEEFIAVEMKTTFNLKLLMQATKRQRIADSVYIAIPYPKGGKRGSTWKDMFLLLRRLELGLIVLDMDHEKPLIEIALHPGNFDRKKSAQSSKKKRINTLKESAMRHGDHNKGGSSRSKLMTAYRENSIHIACCLHKFGPLKPADLRKLGTGKKTLVILTNNYYGWFEKISRGIYSLREHSDEFLVQFPEIAQHYFERLKET